MSPEFKLIYDYFCQAQKPDEALILGIGDDCALIENSAHLAQAISIDTSIADRHFPADADPFYIGARALNISLSDLAAMGAKPRWFTLALSLPAIDHAWLTAFSQGLFDAANKAGIILIGGDTTKSSVLSISIQVQGEVDPLLALKRSGAQIGDSIYVSGDLGLAAAGWFNYQQKNYSEPFYSAYLNPQAQLNLGQKLLSIANACIDISDGLLADLGHILKASQCGAQIDCSLIPIQTLLAHFELNQALPWALYGGDDYQLCFTSSLSSQQLAEQNIAATKIGKIVKGTGCSMINLPDDILLTQQGFDHFYESPV